MRLIKILLLLQLIISLSSCGPSTNKKTNARKVEWDPDKRVKQNIEDGKSFKLFDTKKGFGKATTYDFASSNELWRATLDTIDFMPLTTANYSGGIIVTDWYSDNQNLNENIKITVRFLTNEIRSDALDLKIFYRNCDSSNKCKIFEKDGNLSKELKKEILKKAVSYQQQAKDKKDKKD
jgi:hypothetical protein